MDPLLALLRQTPRKDWQWNLDAKTGWSRNNALSLANCALLAYNDKTVIDQHLKARGFSEVFHFQSNTPRIDTQAFMAINNDAVVVSFRGTEPTNPVDFFTDFTTAPIAFKDKFGFSGWGTIWEGWAMGLLAVWPQLLQKLSEYDNDKRSLWITGHSLGGAIATVMAAVVANLSDHPIQGVYTYGQPRVGDPDFCKRYNQKLGNCTFRHVNNYDLVPHIPPRRFTLLEQALFNADDNILSKFLDLAKAVTHKEKVYQYDHIGQLRLLLPQGGWTADLDKETELEPDFLKEERANPLAALTLTKLTLEAAVRIKDHAPINSVTHDGYIDRLEQLT